MPITRTHLLAAFLLISSACLPMASAAEGNSHVQKITIKSPADYAKTPWAKLNIPAGTKLLTRKAENGKELHRLEFAGGVTIEELEEGGTLSMDNSKGGAVMCLWDIYATIKSSVDKCYPEEKEMRQNFELGMDKLEKFIIANSLTPVTKEDLDNALKKKQDNVAQCPPETDKIAKNFVAKKTEMMAKFQKSIDEALIVPRPPVLNPCL